MRAFKLVLLCANGNARRCVAGFFNILIDQISGFCRIILKPWGAVAGQTFWDKACICRCTYAISEVFDHF